MLKRGAWIKLAQNMNPSLPDQFSVGDFYNLPKTSAKSDQSRVSVGVLLSLLGVMQRIIGKQSRQTVTLGL